MTAAIYSNPPGLAAGSWLPDKAMSPALVGVKPHAWK